MPSPTYCAKKVILSCLLLTLPAMSMGAQQHRRKATAKPASASPAPKPATLLGCGVSVKVPPGWELSLARAREPAESVAKPARTPESETKPEESSSAPSVDEAERTKPPAAAPQANDALKAAPPPCSFVLAAKAPSALITNTTTEGPVGQMELRVVDGDLDTAAAILFQKDEKGWYAQDSRGTRADAKLTRQRTMQILSGVIVHRCYDRSGKARGLCEVSKYVYSNGRRNLLVTAGPYMGETEYVVLNSIRFLSGAPATKKRTHH